MRITVLNILVLGLGLIVGQVRVASAAETGTAFTYQGRLTVNGTPANGEYDFEFRLYDNASGGTQVGNTVTQDNVTVAGGLFTEQLDFGSEPFNGDARWLGIAVRPSNNGGTYTILTPRQELTSNPYAICAQTSAGGWGGGTSGYIPKFTDNTTLGNSVIYESVGKVGVGTNSPTTALEVAGIVCSTSGGFKFPDGTTQTAAATVDLISIDGVSNPGGDVDLISQDAITIAPDNVAKTITIGETHSVATGNPHQVTAAQTGALVSVDGVSNPGGNVDFVAGTGMAITPDPAGNRIILSASSGIKQVIRGVTPEYGWDEQSKTVAFSPSIDPSKAITFVPNRAILTSSTGNQAWAIVTDLTSNSITIEICKHAGSFKVSYQIIEYY